MKAETATATGFTLVELVVVIVVSAVLALAVGQYISLPIESYAALSRRGELVDIASTALHRMTHDLRAALPNSIRVGCSVGVQYQCVEFLNVFDGGRYRAAPPGDILSFNPANADMQFEVTGPLLSAGTIITGSGASDCRDGVASCLAIYNTGLAGTNAYNGDNLATVTALDAGPPIRISFHNGGFSGGQTAFPAASPGQRFYMIDTPVSYVCDLSQNTIRRYRGYTITADHTDVDSHTELLALSNPAEHALLVSQVSACNFDYVPGSPTRNGLITITLTLNEAGEAVTLVQQTHVSNLP